MACFRLTVQGRNGFEVKAVETFSCWEPGSLDAPFHHSTLPVNEFQFRQSQQIAGMIDTLSRTLLCDLVMFPQEGWQPQGLQMMGQQKLWRIVHVPGHDRPPDSSAM